MSTDEEIERERWRISNGGIQTKDRCSIRLYTICAYVNFRVINGN